MAEIFKPVSDSVYWVHVNGYQSQDRCLPLACVAVVGAHVSGFSYAGAPLLGGRVYWFGVGSQTAASNWRACQSLRLVAERAQRETCLGPKAGNMWSKLFFVSPVATRVCLASAPRGDAAVWPLDDGGELRLQLVHRGGRLSAVRWYQNREQLGASLIYPNTPLPTAPLPATVHDSGRTLLKRTSSGWQPAAREGQPQTWWQHVAVDAD